MDHEPSIPKSQHCNSVVFIFKSVEKKIIRMFCVMKIMNDMNAGILNELPFIIVIYQVSFTKVLWIDFLFSFAHQSSCICVQFKLVLYWCVQKSFI